MVYRAFSVVRLGGSGSAPGSNLIDGVVPVTLQETFHSWTLANRDWEEWFAPKSHDFR